MNEWINTINLPDDEWITEIKLPDDEWITEIQLPGDPPKTKDDYGRDRANDLPRRRIM